MIVVGAAGRMGRMLVRAVVESENMLLAGAVDRKDSPALGEDAGTLAGVPPLGVTITDDPLPLFAAADGVLDFTTPDATLGYAALAAQARLVHVIGTTGLSRADMDRLHLAGRHATIVQSGNMSLGVNLLAALVARAAAALPAEFDIEIVEMHHRMKVDAPSGTALMLGEAAARGRGVTLAGAAVRGRDGITGERPAGAIGFASLRGGSVVGEHGVILAGNGERIELRHHAEDRGLFAAGAIKAALWAHGRKPGLYSMNDVLGLKEI